MTDHDSPADRAGRQSANLARHLNGQYPGTVMLLARHAPGGRPDATAAELTGADDDGLVITVTTPDGTAELRLALPDGSDVRTRIGALLKGIRAGLPDTVPLTSLEEQMAGGGRGPHRAAHRVVPPPSAAVTTGQHLRRHRDVELLYFDGCPNWGETKQRLAEALAAVGADPSAYRLVAVTNVEEAERLKFRGSPTVLVDGQDPFADPDAPVGLACRVYRTPDGLRGAPTVEQLVAVLT